MIRDNQFKRFDAYSVETFAFDLHGVYALYDTAYNVTYYGRANGIGVTIKSRLKDHLSGREGRCTQSANFFKQEATANAAERERELLHEYYRTHGRLPRCNDRVG